MEKQKNPPPFEAVRRRAGGKRCGSVPRTAPRTRLPHELLLELLRHETVRGTVSSSVSGASVRRTAAVLRSLSDSQRAGRLKTEMAKKKGRRGDPSRDPNGVRRKPQPMSSCSSFLAISSIFSGGQPGMSIPSRSPIEDKTSLISFSDLRPKLGVRSISASVFWTRSPM